MTHRKLLHSGVVACGVVWGVCVASAQGGEFQSDETKLVCYSGESLELLRGMSDGGRFISITPDEIKAAMKKKDTVAILLLHKKKDKKIVVGVVKKGSTEIQEIKTYDATDGLTYFLLHEGRDRDGESR
jgi:hypothetical protein